MNTSLFAAFSRELQKLAFAAFEVLTPEHQALAQSQGMIIGPGGIARTREDHVASIKSKLQVNPPPDKSTVAVRRRPAAVTPPAASGTAATMAAPKAIPAAPPVMVSRPVGVGVRPATVMHAAGGAPHLPKPHLPTPGRVPVRAAGRLGGALALGGMALGGMGLMGLASHQQQRQ